MSEDIEMMESFPSINPSKRKDVMDGEFDLQESGQGDSYSVGGAAETVRKRRRVGSHDFAGDPSSLGMVNEPLAQPGAPFREDAEELEGNLVVPDTPILSGGYANIFRGQWTSSEGTVMDVAVKTMRPIWPTSMSCRPDPIALQQRREKRLKREVAVWNRLIHPNVHPLLGFRTRPEPCLVSSWCQNGNLVDYLNNNPNLPRPEKLQLLVQTARGLAFLHSQSPPICHADIKPENVLVNDLCEAALTDFGISRVIQELGAPTGFTTGDGPKGSQNYMAPELLGEDDSQPTLETDVYAFGGLALAVTSGSPPFAQIKAPAKVLVRIIQGKHPKPEEHPGLERNDSLWSTILRCWVREPESRPTISDVEVELNKCRFLGTQDPPPSSITIPLLNVPDLQPQRPPPERIDSLDDVSKLARELKREYLTVDKYSFAKSAVSDIFGGRWAPPEHPEGISVAVRVLRIGPTTLPGPVSEYKRYGMYIAREIFVWQQVQHPRITPLIGYIREYKDGVVPCLVTKRRQGNILDYLARNPEANRLTLLCQAVEGLVYLHTLPPFPFIHLNIKPSNILVTDEGDAELCDVGYGRTKVLNDVSPYWFMRYLNFAYMSPELLDGVAKKDLTPAADIFGLGSTIIYILSGKRAWDSIKSKIALMIRVMRGIPPAREEYPMDGSEEAIDTLWNLLVRCWSQDPSDRPSTQEVLDTLRTIEGMGGVRPPRQEPVISTDGSA